MQINFNNSINQKLANDPKLTKISLIYCTKDYDKFKLNTINRTVNANRVDHFIKEYKTRQIISPIEVMLDSKTDKLIILDGQHRFCAWRKLHLPIYFYETISGDDTTQGLRQRNLGKAWTTIDIVNSFALDKRKPEQAAQYYELSRIIKYTQERLGRVPLTVLIELADGINRALDQNIVYTHHDFKNGKYKTYNKDSFITVINRLRDLQTRVHGQLSLTAPVFRALFTILSIKSANAAYLANCINNNRAFFDAVNKTSDDIGLLKSLIDLYNVKAVINKQVPIAYSQGVRGIKISSPMFNLLLPNKK